MEFLGADAHLRAKAELAAIGESRGGVPINRGGIYLLEKFIGIGFVLP